MTGISQLLFRQSLDRFLLSFPYRPIDHARLTESAPPGASAKGFHHAAVVDRVDKWNNIFYREFRLVQILHHCTLDTIRRSLIKFFDFFDGSVFVVNRFIKIRDINALQLTGFL